jgi:hypothetical protein
MLLKIIFSLLFEKKCKTINEIRINKLDISNQKKSKKLFICLILNNLNNIFFDNVKFKINSKNNQV